MSFIGVGWKIVQKESPLALYKGLGAVTAGIVPKMAIRFTSFQFYKDLMTDGNGVPWRLNNFWGMVFCVMHFVNKSAVLP
jgi:solute carrier family 25 citrate transporter 1